MKKFILCQLCAAFVLVSSAQYRKVDFYNTCWNLTFVMPGAGTCDYFYEYSYILQKDTLISGVLYHKVGPTQGILRLEDCSQIGSSPYLWNDFHFLRQDSARRLIIVLDGALKERILYNFNKVTGDTVSSFYAATNQMRVDTVKGVDSVKLGDNLFHRRLQLADPSPLPFYLIEGIGGEYDFSHPFWGGSHHVGQYVIRFKQCVSTIKSNTRLFPEPLAGAGNVARCGIITSVNEHQETLRFNIGPNPVTNELNINGDGQANSYIIYNLMGQKVLQGSDSNGVRHIKVENLNPGVYMLLLETHSGLYRARLLKE